MCERRHEWRTEELPLPLTNHPTQPRTFGDVAQAYLDRHVRRHLVPRAYQLALYAHTFLASVEVSGPTGDPVAFSDKPFHLISTDDVEHAIERKAEAGCTTVQVEGKRSWTRRVGGGPTANRLHAYLRSLWRWAIAKGYTETTPFSRAGFPTLRMRPEHARERRLMDDEGARLLEACGLHLRDVVTAALESGCRKQELLSLQWSQVHWDRNELWLPGTKTKTKRPRRIPISEALHTVLLRRRHRSTGQPYEMTDYVFGHADGSRVWDIKTAWNASCRRAGITGLHFHDLRHEAGSRKLEAGYPMHAVSLWLGHSTLTTTARYLNADIGQLHALNDRPIPPALRASL
ncbi:MAG: site-specific integrase [Vicinamibacterales bacterium]